MKLLFGIIAVFVLMLIYLYIDVAIAIKRARELKKNHKSFKNIPEDDIEVINGQVFVKVLDHVEYKRFKKITKDQKKGTKIRRKKHEKVQSRS